MRQIGRESDGSVVHTTSNGNSYAGSRFLGTVPLISGICTVVKSDWQQVITKTTLRLCVTCFSESSLRNQCASAADIPHLWTLRTKYLNQSYERARTVVQVYKHVYRNRAAASLFRRCCGCWLVCLISSTRPGCFGFRFLAGSRKRSLPECRPKGRCQKTHKSADTQSHRGLHHFKA